MEKRRCGNSGLELSVLGIGCWSFGGGTYWGDQDQSDVNRVVRRAVELGISYFDTAEVYNDGRSESSLGKAIRGLPRDKIIIGTKISPSNVQPKVLFAHCDASLKRLDTDYIDLYMVHWPITPHSIRHFTSEDISCPPVEAVFKALGRLQDQGKIRYIGVSNFASSKLKEALDTGTVIVVNELPYSLLSRAIEYDILAQCAQVGAGVIGYFPLQQGLLAARYQTLEELPLPRRRTRHFDSRKVKEARHGGPGAEEELRAALEGIRRICREVGLLMTQAALKWALANRDITCVLAGSRNLKQLQDNAEASSKLLAEDVVQRLNGVTDPLKESLGPSFDYYESPDNDRTR